MMKKFMVIDSKADVTGQLIMMYLETKHAKWEGLIDEKFPASTYFEEASFIYTIMTNQCGHVIDFPTFPPSTEEI